MNNDEWVSNQMRSLQTVLLKQRAYAGYKLKYQEAYDNEKIEHRKDNAGTRAANLALLNFIKRVKKHDQEFQHKSSK